LLFYNIIAVSPCCHLFGAGCHQELGGVTGLSPCRGVGNALDRTGYMAPARCRTALHHGGVSWLPRCCGLAVRVLQTPGMQPAHSTQTATLRAAVPERSGSRCTALGPPAPFPEIAIFEVRSSSPVARRTVST